MPKYYYKCCKCHYIVGSNDGKTVSLSDCKCSKNIFTRPVYKCQRNYWYELLFLTLKDIWRKLNEK